MKAVIVPSMVQPDPCDSARKGYASTMVCLKQIPSIHETLALHESFRVYILYFLAGETFEPWSRTLGRSAKYGWRTDIEELIPYSNVVKRAERHDLKCHLYTNQTEFRQSRANREPAIADITRATQ
jgi:hypothetical protein